MGLLGKADDGQKPLWRKYAARQKKAGVKAENITDIVESIRLSGSEEWILVEGQEAVAMINALSKVGQSLWETVTQFSGELKALKIVFAKGKLGFDLEPHEAMTGYWTYDEAEEKVEFSDSDSKKSGTGIGLLSLEAMTITSPSVTKPRTTKQS